MGAAGGSLQLRISKKNMVMLQHCGADADEVLRGKGLKEGATTGRDYNINFHPLASVHKGSQGSDGKLLLGRHKKITY